MAGERGKGRGGGQGGREGEDDNGRGGGQGEKGRGAVVCAGGSAALALPQRCLSVALSRLELSAILSYHLSPCVHSTLPLLSLLSPPPPFPLLLSPSLPPPPLCHQAHPLGRARQDRHCQHQQARLWRCSNPAARGRTRVLGLRSHTPGCFARGQAPYCHHPRTWSYVCDGQAQQRAGWLCKAGALFCP